MGVDPLPGSEAVSQSMNCYVYVLNDPINGVDAYGLEDFEVLFGDALNPLGFLRGGFEFIGGQLVKCQLSGIERSERKARSGVRMENLNQAQQQVIELNKALEQEAHRVAGWAVCCLIFALAASALVAATKSLVFLVVALFAWFFAWNRRRLWRFLIACLPPPNENQDAWLEKTVERLRNPPSWYRFSEDVAAVTFLMGFGLITIVVASTSGMWMRLLYAACWLLIAILLVTARLAQRSMAIQESPPIHVRMR